MKQSPKSAAKAAQAAKVVILDNSDPISAETEAIQSRIRQRAFELSQVRPVDATELYDWMRAESEIISVPPAELIEKGQTFEVKFAVAGVNPDDVHVMVTPDRILLKSEVSHRHESGSGTVHLCDFPSATVFRSLNLPQPIDVNSVKVEFPGGMVVVSVAKQVAQSVAPKRARARKEAARKGRSRVA
jgi:HSP20 family molecular chaperone IbpA